MSGRSARPGSVTVQPPPNPSGSSRPWVSLKEQARPASLGRSPALGREWGLIHHELEGLIPEADGNKRPQEELALTLTTLSFGKEVTMV